MGKIEKNNIFIQNTNWKDRMIVFRDNLKRHLSNEFLYLSDKKDDLENQVLQLKIEKEQKDKTLFQTMDKRNVRKYFSPLNLSEIEEDQKDEKQKQLSMSIERLKDEIILINQRIDEIKGFLKDIDELICEENILSSEDKKSEMKIDLPIDLLDHGMKSNTEKEDSDIKISEKSFGFMDEKRRIYPQFLRNLYELCDFLQEKYENLDVLIECNDNNIELDLVINQNLIEQLEYNINMALRDYEISMVLIQGSVKEEYIDLCVSYMCEDEQIDTVKITYFVQRT